MRIALGVEYRGSAYAGWQTQKSGVPTVAEQLEAALAQVAGIGMPTVCAGRTDRGVHASGQVVHFDSPVARPERAWVLGTNHYLPADIAVLWAKVVPETFHARFSARWRSYRYVLLRRLGRQALLHDLVTVVHRPLSLTQIRAAGNLLLGEQDFQSFRSAQCQAPHARRTLMHFAVEENDEWVTLHFTANAFLHHMVRNLVGSLLAVGFGERSLAWLAEVLAQKDRRLASVTAPPYGLYLAAVGYPKAFALPQAAAAGRFPPWGVSRF